MSRHVPSRARWREATCAGVASLCLALPPRTVAAQDWCAGPAPLVPGQVWTHVQPTAVRDSAIVTVCAALRSDVEPLVSYLGALRYDSTRVTVLAVLPAPGGLRRENPLERGRIRFAGVLSEGTRATPLLIASIRARDPVGVTLSLELAELNARDGSSLVPRVTVSGYPPAPDASSAITSPADGPAARPCERAPRLDQLHPSSVRRRARSHELRVIGCGMRSGAQVQIGSRRFAAAVVPTGDTARVTMPRALPAGRYKVRVVQDGVASAPLRLTVR